MSESHTFDVCVVGSGAAGFAAALAARLNGKSVLMVEKEEQFGGTTALAAGAMWIPGSDQAAAKKVADGPEQAMRYLEAHVGPQLHRERAETFLRMAPGVLRLFEEQGFAHMDLVANWPDYHPDEPDGAVGGRSLVPRPFDGRELGPWFEKLRPPLKTMMAWGGFMLDIRDMPHVYRMHSSLRSSAHVAGLALRYLIDRLRYSRGTRLTNGNALVGRLAVQALRRGVTLWTDSPAVALIEDNGRISGVRVVRDNRQVEVRTCSGVVLAAGGHPRDLTRLKHVYPHVGAGHDHFMVPPGGNTGDGVKMAEQHGAPFVAAHHHAAAWTPVSLVPQKHGDPLPFPHFIDRGKPGYISVDRRGRRFVSESVSYHSFGAAMLEACRGDDEVAAWNICDGVSIRRFGLGALGPAPMPVRRFLRSGYIKRGRTVAELANACGIDPTGLQQTVARFNEFARTGEDLDFQRGGDAYQVFNGYRGNKPNPCLGKIEHPPYYAVKMRIGDLGTFGGLATNAKAQVLGRNGRPIPGLYAAGNDTASFMGGTYPASGICIAPAIVFGYIAGQMQS